MADMTPHMVTGSRVLVTSMVLAIVVASLMPEGFASVIGITTAMENVGHVFAYGALAFVVVVLQQRYEPASAAVVVALLTLMGLGLEWIQPMFDRMPDWIDVLSNALGAALGALVANLLLRGIGPVG